MRVGALLASVILFVVFLYLVLTGAEQVRYISVAFVLVFAVLATRLDDIQDLTFGPTGLAAKLAKQLEEARATVKQLQDFAEVFAARSVQQIAGDNRMSGLSPKQKREAIAEIVGGLKSLQLPDDRINRVLSLSDPYDDYDYWSWTMSPIYSANDTKVKDLANQFFNLGASKGIGHNPDAETTEKFLKDHDLYQGEIAECMTDWQYWKANHKHRRLDEWEARHERRNQARSFEDVLNIESKPGTKG
ncbi:hypothetical protein [Rhizobium leguminosarum]|jgi:hypothetical protein|uniref:Uncharacterized protein n=1 Tax=Rhizobium leguminosarum bv. trifolii (strain WSM1325) TaxID=395491 RepID=C6ASE5_RHILS|nr:hypothetical protein [Rhizobium leguminosarum]ACS57192.1 hypothetical protein Rleg_2932 [Rhizobium leguminosarum bv. trifolii WSM1325]MBY2906052.1 hypothetical protein [Rhizobium leguminosarum]MBY2945610.1 hypothetical protein [Rhizobium leguminosarum]MBY2964514.1 hypothetical protein [Rhizobium leguminosarum]MBY2986636.1 hypothetical protein [Rhizobium leguminosarum]